MTTPSFLEVSTLGQTIRLEAIEKWAKPLIDELCTCVGGKCQVKITDAVKDSLIEFIDQSNFVMPKCFEKTAEGCYARRLIYEDPKTKFAVVAMTWGPGQSTAIHDHSGEWCVEAVAAGKIDVIQYEMLDERDGSCRMEERGRITAGKGSGGALIPPYEHHLIANTSKTEYAVTIHVYAKSLDRCGVFEPAENGRYRKITKQLDYQPYLDFDRVL